MVTRSLRIAFCFCLITPTVSSSSELFAISEMSIGELSVTEIQAGFKHHIDLCETAPERLYLAWELLVRAETMKKLDYSKMQEDLSGTVSRLIDPTGSIVNSPSCQSAPVELWARYVRALENRSAKTDARSQDQEMQELLRTARNWRSQCEESPEVAYAAGRIFLQARAWSASRECFEFLHEYESEALIWVSHLVFVYGRQDLHEKRLEFLELAWSLGADPQDTYGLYSSSLKAVGREEEARLYEKATPSNTIQETSEARSERVEESSRLGLISMYRQVEKYMRSGEYDKALATSRKALAVASTAHVQRKALMDRAQARLLAIGNRIEHIR